MDRDLVLAGLLIISVGITLLGVAPWPMLIRPKRSAREWERATWRAVWWRSVPVVAVVSILIGWALVEPAVSDEPLPLSALVVSGLFTIVWIRAAVRALMALNAPPPVAGTIGIWHPRAVWSQAFVQAIDPEALDAARLHEEAHVRHRDPARIWLAQIITDLQWPWPSARRRFAQWRSVLELARDEEARLAGADGADLAAAVLTAAQFRVPPRAGATLWDGGVRLEERIDRLLGPMASAELAEGHGPALAVVPISIAGVLSGMRFGEFLVQALVRWL